MSVDDIDYKRLLTEQFKDVVAFSSGEEGVWTALANSLNTVYKKNVDYPRDLLRKIRDERDNERIHIIKGTKQLGFDYRSDDFSDEEFRRLMLFLGLYYEQKGSVAFSRFLGYIKNSIFKIDQLWTEDYLTFVKKSSVSTEDYLIKGGTFYPTSHVSLSYDSSKFPIDDSDVFSLFYKIAPIHLVLEALESQYFFDPDYVFVTKPAFVDLSVSNAWNYTIGSPRTVLGQRSTYRAGRYELLNDFFPVENYRPEVNYSFARTSDGWYWDEFGWLKRVDINTLRNDHDRLTGERKGVVIEKATKNELQSERVNIPSGFFEELNLLSGFYTASIVGPGSLVLSGAVNGTATEGNPVIFEISSPTGSVRAEYLGLILYSQIQEGKIYTLPIPTTVPKTADIISYNITKSVTPIEGTIFSDVKLGDHSQETHYLFSIGLTDTISNSSTSGYEFYWDAVSKNLILLSYENGLSKSVVLARDVLANSNIRIAISWNLQKLKVFINGVGGEIDSGDYYHLTSPQELRLGSNLSATTFLNGWISSLYGWPQFIIDETVLSEITS